MASTNTAARVTAGTTTAAIRVGVLALALLLAACGGKPSDDAAHTGEGGEHAETGHAEADHAEAGRGEGEEAEAAKGEHGGRLLRQDGYTVELAIAEDGTPPKYQAWL
ncbi:MAG: hypothetical protein ACREO8_04505, partial [Luteimonas sp.]